MVASSGASGSQDVPIGSGSYAGRDAEFKLRRGRLLDALGFWRWGSPMPPEEHRNGRFLDAQLSLPGSSGPPPLCHPRGKLRIEYRVFH